MPTFEEYYVDDIEETLKIILTMTLRKISRLNYEVVNPFFVPLKIDSVVDQFFLPLHSKSNDVKHKGLARAYDHQSLKVSNPLKGSK